MLDERIGDPVQASACIGGTVNRANRHRACPGIIVGCVDMFEPDKDTSPAQWLQSHPARGAFPMTALAGRGRTREVAVVSQGERVIERSETNGRAVGIP